MSEDDSILNDFIQEAKEHLEGIEADLLALEEAGENFDVDLVNKVFRAIHSIKGGAGFFGLTNIKELAHIQENILNKIRAGEMVPTQDVMSVLLHTIDTLRDLVEDWQTSNEVDISQELAELQEVDGGEAPVAKAEQTTSAKVQADTSLPVSQDTLKKYWETGHHVYRVNWIPQEDIPMDQPFGEILETAENTGEIVHSDVPLETLQNWCYEEKDGYQPFIMVYATIVDPDIIDTVFPLDEQRIHLIPKVEAAAPIPVEKTEIEPAKEPEETSEKTAPAPKAAAARSKDPEEGTLRVPLRTLNQLMTLAGELVLTRNQLMESLKSQDMTKISAAAQRVDVITSELQMQIMSTRMQPIGKVFSRFQRVVRDLAKMLSKKIKVVIEGKDVELDKTIIESIADPLTHLVRNSVDHGIESPEERKKIGKNPEGCVHLRAFHEAGHVIIEVSDDGKGIDPNRVKEKAIRENLVEKAVLDGMHDKDVVKLIFKPGFSMAKEITEVSGRGVGMDVVYTNFTKLGGVVDIDTQVGLGCTMRIKLPLTLAIIPSLIAEVQNEHFAIPQVNLLELVRVPAKEVKERIQYVGGSFVLRFRDGLLPLLQLTDVLKMHGEAEKASAFIINEETQSVEVKRKENQAKDSKSKKGKKRRRDPSINIAVVNADNFRYGIVVNEFLDSEEIVVKPLGQFIKDCSAYAGATIRGDGHVALILDVLGISDSMNLSAIMDRTQLDEEQDANLEELQTFLVVQNSPTEQFAVPFGLISRIDKVEKGNLESITGRVSVRYADRSLPVVTLQQIQEVGELPDQEFYHVLIFNVRNVEFGLLVSELVDVLETTTPIDDRTFKQEGVLGSFIFKDCTTLLVELFELAQQKYPDLIKQSTPEQISNNTETRILVVDDSRFYRSQIGQFVESEGYTVETAEDGEEAYDKLTSAETPYDLLLTDIEMPRLDGIELTKKVRNTGELKNMPIIAITSLAGRENEEKIRAAGVDRYLIKLAKDEMLVAVGEFVGKKK